MVERSEPSRPGPEPGGWAAPDTPGGPAPGGPGGPGPRARPLPPARVGPPPWGVGQAPPPWPRPGLPWPVTPFGGPARPEYREPHPVRPPGVWAGIGSTVLWFAMFGALSWSARAYVWSTLVAALLALLAALVLIRYGDRGVAVGVAGTAGVGLGIAGIVVLADAIGGHWLLW